MSDLIQACRNGDLEKVKELVKNGVDVNVKNFKGKTALHRAARYGYSEIVKYLKSKGAK